MDLSIIIAQLSELNASRNIPAPKALPAPADKERLAERSNNIAGNVTRKETEAFIEVVKKYSHKFNKLTNNSRVLRVLVRHFMDNWDSMPMEEAWRAEDELREYRVMHKVYPKRRKK